MNPSLLYLVGQLGPGGSERQLFYLLSRLDRKRYRPAVVVWNSSMVDVYASRIRELDVPVYSLSANSSSLAKLRALCRLVRQLQPEVVNSMSFYTNFAASWSCWGTRAIAVGSVRSDFAWAKKDSGFWLGRLSGRWPRSQICNSSLAARNIRRPSDSFFVPAQLYVIHNGVDLERFRYLPPPRNGRIRILGVGSLLPVKRWDRLIRAALALKTSGLDFLVEIAGGGPLRGLLEKQVQDLRLTDYVKLLGHQDDVSALIANSTILAHTSESEGRPNAVMEAMACGRAVVATDAGDIPSLIEDGKSGFVVRRGDDATLVARISTLLRDRDLCCRMGVVGRAKAQREFGLDRLVSETLTAYRAAGWSDSE